MVRSNNNSEQKLTKDLHKHQDGEHFTAKISILDAYKSLRYNSDLENHSSDLDSAEPILILKSGDRF